MALGRALASAARKAAADSIPRSYIASRSVTRFRAAASAAAHFSIPFHNATAQARLVARLSAGGNFTSFALFQDDEGT
ncbi:uncharacterized protein LOC112350124 [Selaginella moellendorffii]|uniref:uncharacterized protein LOC112350124 n=1 Tax=Selaginella moellendorffii TaxID=88036 RepID=UPI000D1C5B57|nr:uncharacterized protein LOC112350124 [Selaginella moellendorffii]|eukprot:XP_024541555.1 uncharacterized protein LOC112350124 [Selaginella moellendorffii]